MSQSSLLLISVLGVVCKNHYIHSIYHLLGTESLLIHIFVDLQLSRSVGVGTYDSAVIVVCCRELLTLGERGVTTEARMSWSQARSQTDSGWQHQQAQTLPYHFHVLPVSFSPFFQVVSAQFFTMFENLTALCILSYIQQILFALFSNQFSHHTILKKHFGSNAKGITLN